jgi:hypothetical protein
MFGCKEYEAEKLNETFTLSEILETGVMEWWKLKVKDLIIVR